MQTTNNNEQNLDTTTEPPSPDIITTTINTSFPRVPDSHDNICLPRVADLDINSPTQAPKTYTDLTRNPGKRRRNAKKKVLARNSFPPPIIEEIAETEQIEQISDPLPTSPTTDTTETTENTSSLPSPTNPNSPPTLSPTQQSSDKPKKRLTKSNVGNIGYKFQNYFPGHGYFQGEVVAIKDVCTDDKDHRVLYLDGDSNDMSLDEIKKCPKASA